MSQRLATNSYLLENISLFSINARYYYQVDLLNIDMLQYADVEQ